MVRQAQKTNGRSTLKTGFLLDTHIWLWHLREDARLTPALRRLIDRSLDRCWLSPASIWELGLLIDRGRVRLQVPIRPWLTEALDRMPLHEAPLTLEVALVTSELDFAHRDPADRFLAATALVYDLTLVTLDPNLIEANWLPTRSR